MRFATCGEENRKANKENDSTFAMTVVEAQVRMQNLPEETSWKRKHFSSGRLAKQKSRQKGLQTEVAERSKDRCVFRELTPGASAQGTTEGQAVLSDSAGQAGGGHGLMSC